MPRRPTRLPNAPHGNAIKKPLLSDFILQDLCCHVRFDDPRSNCIDSDANWCKFTGHRLRQGFKTALGGRVPDAACQPNEGANRRDIDDSSPTLLQQGQASHRQIESPA